MMELYNFQKDLLKRIRGRRYAALFVDMGCGKTIMSSEHVMENYYDGETILVVCQKSKVKDWLRHWVDNYDLPVYDGAAKKYDWVQRGGVTVVNYDLVWRRKALRLWQNYHLIVDESSLLQNDKTKRTKSLLEMKPNTASITLLSGTPAASGKYENMWSQMRLLNWNITKPQYWDRFVRWHLEQFYSLNYPIKIVDGYKNVEVLKDELRDHGAVFMRAEEAFDLPEQVYQTITVPMTGSYDTFKEDRVIMMEDGEELVGDNPLTYLLRLRQLASVYADEKYEALSDIIETCPDKMIVFYNFQAEGHRIADVCEKLKREYAFINGQIKQEDKFHATDGCVLIAQLAASAYGLNLQDSNRVIYMSLPLSADQYMQSEARIHRIGQKKTCFYTYIMMEDSVENDILATLQTREDYTLELFKRKIGNVWNEKKQTAEQYAETS